MEGVDLSPEQEARRIAAVRRYDILDTPPGEAFDRIAALAARLFNAPAATVTIVDAERSGSRPRTVWQGSRRSAETLGCAPRRSLLAALWSSPTPSTPPSPARTHELMTGPARVRFYAAAPISTLCSTACWSATRVPYCGR